jgi:hypothetical protein
VKLCLILALCVVAAVLAGVLDLVAVPQAGAGQGLGSEGGWVLDLDVTPGDQAVREVEWVQPGDELTVEIIICEPLPTTIGAQITLQFDPAEVAPVAYEAKGREGLSLFGPRAVTDTTFTFAVVSLTPLAIGNGSLALATFRMLPDFTGHTRVILVEAQIADGETYQNRIAHPNAAVLVRSGAAGRSLDFDGNGVVARADFDAFGRHYCLTEGDSAYDGRFDLNADGVIGFADFLILGRHYEVSDGGGL